MHNIMIYHALSFPTVDPVILTIGPVKVHWYGLGYVVGILFAWWYGKRLLRISLLWKSGFTPIKPEKLDDFVVWAMIGVVTGGRLGEILFYKPGYYFLHPMQSIAIWDGGMSFHGGFIGTILAVLFFSKKNRIGIWNMLDVIAAGAPIGLGIVRICNFVNSELWGRVSDVPWAIYFPNGGVDVSGKLLARHPSQLYEAMLEGPMLFSVLALLIFHYKGLKKPGFIAGNFTLWYGITGMALSLPMIVIGTVFIIQAVYSQHSI